MTQIKLTELTACAFCKEPLVKTTVGGQSCAMPFFRVRVEQCQFDVQALNQTMGVHMILGGKAFGIAMALGGDKAADVVKTVEVFACINCFGRSIGELLVPVETEEVEP